MTAFPESHLQPEGSSAKFLRELHDMVNEDSELGQLYEEILNRLDDYVLTKMKVVRLSENRSARYHLAEKYEDRLRNLDKDRYAAHNRLIGSLASFAQCADRLGLDRSWWDGPHGLFSDGGPRTARQRVDDWATDIWLEREESEEKGEKVA